MQDSNEEWYLDSALSVIPSNIGLLTQLHTLYLSTQAKAEGGAHMEWVTELTSLQELSITFCYCDGVQHVLLLTNFTCLKVLGQPNWAPTLPFIDIDIEWHRLQALQELCICQTVLQRGKGFASLLELHCLRQISFARNTFNSEEDGAYLAALMYLFDRLRPQVKLIGSKVMIMVQSNSSK